MKHRISVFGLGYVGCVTAGCLARVGHEVTGVDVDPERVRLINEARRSPVSDPGLDQLIGETARQGRLRATTSFREAVEQSDLAFICVGVPGDLHGQLDLDALKRVCRDLGAALEGRQRRFTVVVRSTMLPGTLDNTVRTAILAGAGAALERWLRLAVNPEFIREGSALKDFIAPPMTLVGCEDQETAALLQAVYAGIDAPFVHTRVTTAEMVKYACNAFVALKSSFANEIGNSCEALGVDPLEVMRIFCLDDTLNVSPAYLQPGFAFGGSCLTRDVQALLYAAHHANADVPLLDAVLPSNQAQVQRGVDAILATGKRRVGLLGLASSPNLDDLGGSPLLTLVEALIGKGCEVRIHDRDVAQARTVGAGRRVVRESLPHIAPLLCERVEELVEHAEVLVIGTGDRDVEELRALARTEQIIVDLTRGAGRAALVAREAA